MSRRLLLVLFLPLMLACTKTYTYQSYEVIRSFGEMATGGDGSGNGSGSNRYGHKTGLVIGNAGAANSFSGSIDEIRLSSVARYKVDFKPSRRLRSDDATIALYHCDEKNRGFLLDSSGNGHHGITKGTYTQRENE